MSISSDLPGLKPRLEAAFHVKAVIEGKPFVPIGPDRLADSRDRALANKIATVTLRRHGQISHVLSQMLKKGVPGRAGILEAVLRTAIAQLLYIDDIADHSALHLGVEAARQDKRAGRFDKLVNGVLRGVQRDQQRLAGLPNMLLFPPWLAENWQRQYGAEGVDRFAEALLAGAPLDITLKDGADAAMVSALGGVRTMGSSVRVSSREVSIVDLPGFSDGQWWVQDTAAALPARLLGAAPGQRVLDLCAAPGGKTMQLAATGATVTALDNAPDRMERVKENLERTGLEATLIVADALEYQPGESFDGILLDAPCSATGTFRRHPEVIWHRDKKGIADRVALQRRMIEKAASMLKPGGRLLYCVCSLEAEEGENQLDWVTKAVPALAVDPIDASELEGWTIPVSASGAVRLSPALDLPGEALGTLDGFFIVRFTKHQ